MKVLLRSLFPCGSVDRWRKFESVMKDCLSELGHDLIELHLDPRFPPDPPEAEFKIYAHKTRREVPHSNLFYKEMHLKGLFTLDADGWGPEHSAMRRRPNLDAVDPERAERFVGALRHDFLRTGRSKHAQPARRPIDDRLKPYVLVPLQLPTDDTILNYSPVSVIEFVHIIADWADKAKHNVIFKLHPAVEHPGLAEAVHQRMASSRYLFCLPENIHSLIAEARGVIVINSGVGFESLIHGKPVVTFGQCDYQWATFRGTARNLPEALDYFEGYAAQQQRLGYQFIYFYYWQHAFSVGDGLIGQTKQRVKAYLTAALASAGKQKMSGQ